MIEHLKRLGATALPGKRGRSAFAGLSEIPDDYREYLKEACAYSLNAWCRAGKKKLAVDIVYGGTGKHSVQTHTERIGRDDCVVVAGDSMGNKYALFLSGKRAQAVFFWDHENGRFSRVASSFGEFIQGLVREGAYSTSGPTNGSEASKHLETASVRSTADSLVSGGAQYAVVLPTSCDEFLGYEFEDTLKSELEKRKLGIVAGSDSYLRRVVLFVDAVSPRGLSYINEWVEKDARLHETIVIPVVEEGEVPKAAIRAARNNAKLTPKNNQS